MTVDILGNLLSKINDIGAASLLKKQIKDLFTSVIDKKKYGISRSKILIQLCNLIQSNINICEKTTFVNYMHTKVDDFIQNEQNYKAFIYKSDKFIQKSNDQPKEEPIIKSTNNSNTINIANEETIVEGGDKHSSSNIDDGSIDKLKEDLKEFIELIDKIADKIQNEFNTDKYDIGDESDSGYYMLLRNLILKLYTKTINNMTDKEMFKMLQPIIDKCVPEVTKIKDDKNAIINKISKNCINIIVNILKDQSMQKGGAGDGRSVMPVPDSITAVTDATPIIEGDNAIPVAEVDAVNDSSQPNNLRNELYSLFTDMINSSSTPEILKENESFIQQFIGDKQLNLSSVNKDIIDEYNKTVKSVEKDLTPFTKIKGGTIKRFIKRRAKKQTRKK